MPIEKLQAAIAWLKTCPAWQKPQAAEAALDKAVEVIADMESRIDALERGNHGQNESR